MDESNFARQKGAFQAKERAKVTMETQHTQATARHSPQLGQAPRVLDATEDTRLPFHKQWGATGPPEGKLQSQIYDPGLIDEEIGV